MICFIIGVFVGAGLALMAVGIIVIRMEEKEMKPPQPDIRRWYTEDDGG